MKRREIIYIAIIIILAAIMLLRKPSERVVTQIRCDTVVVRDTIRDTVLLARTSHIIRTDTVWLKCALDTVFVNTEIPIERRLYETDDYRAVVEGFRPQLAEMEVYRNTVYIDRTETITLARPKRWGVGIQAGYGLTRGGAEPYIGVGIQYNLFMW